jgi:hypothetical protein
MASSVPVLLLCWRRPSTTAQVLEQICQYRPSYLFVACDGPNPDNPREIENVAATRALIENAVDWPCSIERLYSDTNQGCRLGVTRAISWFFQKVEEGIILEDDCVPSPYFFPYCQALLEQYREDVRIWQICGYNRFGAAVSQPQYSYFFSRYGPVWGWASWRRAWVQHNDDINWPYHFRDDQSASVFYSYPPERIAKLLIAERLHRRELDTWDYQWGFTKTANNALSIVPAVNLIHNIGFGEGATHTSHPQSVLPVDQRKLNFPLRHPPFVVADTAFDQRYTRSAFPPPSLKTRIRRLIRHTL